MKTFKLVLIVGALVTMAKLIAADLIPLYLAWDKPDYAPDAFILYEANNATGAFYKVDTFPGTNILALIHVDKTTNHFWFLTASNVLGESLPSNTVTATAPVRVTGIKLNKTNN